MRVRVDALEAPAARVHPAIRAFFERTRGLLGSAGLDASPPSMDAPPELIAVPAPQAAPPSSGPASETVRSAEQAGVTKASTVQTATRERDRGEQEDVMSDSEGKAAR